VNRSLRAWCMAAILLVSAAAAHAQPPPATLAAEKQLKDAPSIPLPARTVSNSVGVSATLLTHHSVQRIFGKEIASTYAVVQLTVSNRNPDAAFVLHSAYLDVSQWALGGAGLKGVTPSLQPYQSSTVPNAIASVEARIARGQMLDAQTWSARNWTVRLLTVAGSVASAVVFNAGETTAKYVAAFNGAVVPGVAIAWPDGSVGQLNRISDFGFQTNKVFPKESSDVIVCFFPMDLFLSPGLREIFVHSPGLFLSPYQILFTKENGNARLALGLPSDPDAPPNKLARTALICFPGPSEKGVEQATAERLERARKGCPAPDTVDKSDWEATLKLLEYIGRFGANNIPVIIDGVMTVEVDTVPAAIDDITFDGNANTPAFWASGEHRATLQCRFCANGQVIIQEASTLGIDPVKVIGDESNEHKLTFSFKLTKPVDTNTVLHIVVTKPSSDPKKSDGIKSMPFSYTVSYAVVTPTVTGVSVGDKVTLKGTSFSNLTSHPAALSLGREGGLAGDKSIAWPSDATATTLSFDVPGGIAPGCWDVKMKWNNVSVDVPHSQNSEKILVATKPTLTDAKRSGNSIVVTGSELADTSACGGRPLKLQVTGPNSQTIKDLNSTFDSLKQMTLPLPAAAKTGSWFVRIGDDDATKVAVK
jgi:hypothetical protein